MQTTPRLGGTPLVAAAGGIYTDVDAFHEAISNVDILIDETYLVSTYNDFLVAYQLSANAGYKFLQNLNVWRNDGIQNPSGAQGLG